MVDVTITSFKYTMFFTKHHVSVLDLCSILSRGIDRYFELTYEHSSGFIATIYN